MTEWKCKNCAAPLNVSKAIGGVVTCEYCGSVFTLPKPEQSEKVRLMLASAEAMLDVCKFDDALTLYGKAAELDQTEPEAWFGKALARFRVQYLKDTVNNRLQPICHRMTESAFADDGDYKKAVENATDKQRPEYDRRAAEIDYIRREFYTLAKSGLDYDSFICVKVTDESGNPTRDSLDASRLYHTLRKKGYKPFYSEFEIEGRTGSNYEAMILYALYVSECMLIICSDERYLETKWVKNEYARFISLMGDERKERNSIAIAFRGKPIELLAGVKGRLQGIDLGGMDAVEKIKDFIDRHDEDKQRRKREQEAAREKDRLAAIEAARAEEARRREEAERKADELEKRLKELESRAAGNGAQAAQPKEAEKDASALQSPEESYQAGLSHYNAKEYEAAIPYFHKAAEQGHASAQFFIGVCYYIGQGVEKNYGEAVKWYRKASEQGEAPAQNNLGICYNYGQGVERNYGEAAKWYRKAAEQGFASAQFLLGVCYHYGQGVPQNYGEAVKWYRKAVEQGDANAQCWLGICYENGEGVPCDLKEAAKWFRKAAAQGYEKAKQKLSQEKYRGL